MLIRGGGLPSEELVAALRADQGDKEQKGGGGTTEKEKGRQPKAKKKKDEGKRKKKQEARKHAAEKEKRRAPEEKKKRGGMGGNTTEEKKATSDNPKAKRRVKGGLAKPVVKRKAGPEQWYHGATYLCGNEVPTSLSETEFDTCEFASVHHDTPNGTFF